MKIALLTLDFPPDPGGVQTYLYELASRLAREHEVVVLTPIAGPPVDPSGLRRVQLARPSFWAFWRALRAESPDRVWVGHAHPKLLMAAAFGVRRRYLTVAHGNDFLAAQRCWHHGLFNRLLQASDPLVTNTQANATRLRGLGIPDAVVVRPGTNPRRFGPRNERLPMPPVLLTVGRLVPRKGIDLVIRALPELLRSFPGLRYRVAGAGPDLWRLQSLARDLGVTGAVEFIGYVADDELAGLYQDAHLFVMPSREEPSQASVEGFGIVYLEASASGLAVIGGRSGGTREAIRDGCTGYLVEPGSVEELVERITEVILNERLRWELGLAGRRWVEAEMNWDRAAHEMDQALCAPKCDQRP